MVDDARQGQGPGGPLTSGPVAERMQALLSRAVEDQIGEQRQVAAVVGELREQVAALGAAYRATATQSDLQQVGTALHGQTGEVRGEVRTVGSDLAARLDELSRRVEEVATRSARGLEALQALPVVRPQDLDQAVAGLTGRLEPLPASLAGLDARLGGVADTLGALGTELARVGEAAAPVPGVADDLARLAGRVEDLPPQLLEGLAPRVADLVLERAGQTLVQQVAEAVAARVAAEVPPAVSALVAVSTAASEQRVMAHVDEAVLVLAEALLRRRRTPRTDFTAALAATGDTAAAPQAAAAAAPVVPPPAPPVLAPPAADPAPAADVAALPTPVPAAATPAEPVAAPAAQAGGASDAEPDEDPGAGPGRSPAVTPVVGLVAAAPQEAGTGDTASLAADDDVMLPEVMGYDDDATGDDDDATEDDPALDALDLLAVEGEAQEAAVALDLRDVEDAPAGRSARAAVTGGLAPPPAGRHRASEATAQVLEHDDDERGEDGAGRSRPWWRPSA